ncbi:hypothetical protein [Halomarina litorea]|uniref:hypothetical protein n=1 Tax=Halomarina litorea TaxID=2961595 RepID=UPI0020C24FE6|nr:hypothetical protein [Halomarina sp. BCD28]
MAKVSIGLRGWRFDEEAVLDDDGAIRPLAQMPEEARERIARLATLVNKPCDACWLIHGEEEKERSKQARVVYGEPLGEVLLCNDHEADFLYWFREEDGSDLAGNRLMQNAFHQWFDDGGRAPEDYGGMDHVDTDPDSVVQPDPSQDLPDLEQELADMTDEEREALDIDLSDLDI